MPATDAPTNELGYAAGLGMPTTSVVAAGGFTIEQLELTPELTFPASATVYSRMRTDGQISAILRAIILPILATRARLKGENVRPELIKAAELEFGLGDQAEGRARRRGEGVTFREHLRDALQSAVFGFMPFEQVYTVAPPSDAQAAADAMLPRLMAHVGKLAPRFPRTLLDIRVDRAGGLAGIVQSPPPGQYSGAYPTSGIPIPVDRLVYYCPEREGADFTGVSLLRSAYKHWLIKEALLRLGPMVVERNGMGVPVVTYPESGSEAKALRLAKAFRAGSDAGAAMEEGYTLTLVGVTGTTKDELPLVNYHDQAASRSLLAMFLDLGHDGGLGHGSIGNTFLDLFLLSERGLMEHIEEIFTEHVIRDWVELNYGADEPYPELVFDPIDAEATPTAEALKLLADAGLIVADGPLKAEIRRRYRLPKPDEATTVVPPAAPATYQPAGTGPNEGPPSTIDPSAPAPPPAAPGPVHVPAHTRQPPAVAATAEELVERTEALVGRLAALAAG